MRIEAFHCVLHSQRQQMPLMGKINKSKGCTAGTKENVR